MQVVYPFFLESMALHHRRRIAQGGFGFIDLVEDVASQRSYAMKILNVENASVLHTVEKEITVMSNLRHDNIVRYVTHEISRSAGACRGIILMEFCPNGHLLEHLNRRDGRRLPEHDVLMLLDQISRAIHCMHSHNPQYIHRDLKLENLLLSMSGSLKLCDFGSAIIGNSIPLTTSTEREAADDDITRCTTPMYRSPEMCDLYMTTKLTAKMDIWAIGCLLYAICFLVHPFQNVGNLGIINAKISFPNDSPYSHQIHDIICRLLDTNPDTRADIDEIRSCVEAAWDKRNLPSRRPPVEVTVIQHKPSESSMRMKATTAAAPAKIVHKNLDPNSAAARRLANRHGGQPESSSSSSVVVEPIVIVQTQPKPTQLTSNDGFGDWNAHPVSPPAANRAALEVEEKPQQENSSSVNVSSFFMSDKASSLFFNTKPDDTPKVHPRAPDIIFNAQHQDGGQQSSVTSAVTAMLFHKPNIGNPINALSAAVSKVGLQSYNDMAFSSPVFESLGNRIENDDDVVFSSGKNAFISTPPITSIPRTSSGTMPSPLPSLPPQQQPRKLSSSPISFDAEVSKLFDTPSPQTNNAAITDLFGSSMLKPSMQRQGSANMSIPLARSPSSGQVNTSSSAAISTMNLVVNPSYAKQNSNSNARSGKQW